MKQPGLKAIKTTDVKIGMYILRRESVAMMKFLFDDPTTENNRGAKKGISEIIYLILKKKTNHAGSYRH